MAAEPIYKAIQELRKELERIDYVIHAVESLSEGKRRRGRPPKFLAEAMAQAKKANGRASKAS